MFTRRQLADNSQTTRRQLSVLLLVFALTILMTSNTKAQQMDLRYIIHTPSDCVGLCSFDPPPLGVPWNFNNDIIITLINDDGVPCTFHCRYAWRRCNGKLYIQNQELYSELPAGCMIGELRHTTAIFNAIYKASLENLIANNIATASDTARCYVPTKCVKFCPYDDTVAGVCRAFYLTCSNNPFSGCCYIDFAYNTINNQAYRLTPIPIGGCSESILNCPNTVLYDGRTLTLSFIPFQILCEPQCEGN
jgi:hypothetical protein